MLPASRLSFVFRLSDFTGMVTYDMSGNRGTLRVADGMQGTSHLIRRCTGRVGRGVDAPVTIHALHSMSQMTLMCEIDEIRKTLKAHP